MSVMFAVDRLDITILVENSIDILLPDTPEARRVGLLEHFDKKRTPLLAENGFSLLLEAYLGDSKTTVLFDAGLTSRVILHNIEALGIDPTSIDHIVLSHAHLDHHGGLEGVLAAIAHPVPVLTHPDAFLPRYIVTGVGKVSPYYNSALNRERLEAAGACFVLATEPVSIAPGTITTGEIERLTDFEGPPTEPARAGHSGGIFQIRDGRFVPDLVMDEVALVINLAGKGLIVITGCGHAGVINTVVHARKLTGVEPIAAILGGFHLGFPGTSDRSRTETVAALAKLDPTFVAPMHCTGFRAMADVAAAMPDRFFQYSVGTRLSFPTG
jgi:7,8-dihydropterin-6-yl-methyl-4-(beta-D-ribofuranosyl)aminobenzene 5'-phosphate synthase